MSKIVPPEIILAAKRGFVRTTAQAYAASIPAGGVSAAAILALLEQPVDYTVIVVTALAALLSPPLAGLASYLSITSKGIPEDYQPNEG